MIPTTPAISAPPSISPSSQREMIRSSLARLAPRGPIALTSASRRSLATPRWLLGCAASSPLQRGRPKLQGGLREAARMAWRSLREIGPLKGEFGQLLGRPFLQPPLVSLPGGQHQVISVWTLPTRPSHPLDRWWVRSEGRLARWPTDVMAFPSCRRSCRAGPKSLPETE
jgi:hypothetical protein